MSDQLLGAGNRQHIEQGTLSSLGFSVDDTIITREVFFPLYEESIQSLSKGAQSAVRFISDLTGHTCHIVGSLKLGAVTPFSDIDLAIGCSDSEKISSAKLLSQHFEFRGERPARLDTTRFLFRMDYEGIPVDINIMLESDLNDFLKGLDSASTQMSPDEKFECAYAKYILQRQGAAEELEQLKLVHYKRFCPELEWLTDQEILKRISTEASRYGSLCLPEKN